MPTSILMYADRLRVASSITVHIFLYRNLLQLIGEEERKVGVRTQCVRLARVRFNIGNIHIHRTIVIYGYNRTLTTYKGIGDGDFTRTERTIGAFDADSRAYCKQDTS